MMHGLEGTYDDVMSDVSLVDCLYGKASMGNVKNGKGGMN